MSVTHAANIRDALATVIKDAVEVGSGDNAVIDFREGTDLIVQFDLSHDPTAFTGPTDAVLELDGVPIAAVAIDNAAAVDNFVVRNKDGDPVLSGSITAVGMGGDIEVTNVNIALGQDCSLEELTYEAPE